MLYGHPFNNGQFPLSRQQLVIGADGTSYCNDWKRYQTFYVKDTSDQCAVYIAPATALKRWPTPVERLNKRRVGGWVGSGLLAKSKLHFPPALSVNRYSVYYRLFMRGFRFRSRSCLRPPADEGPIRTRGNPLVPRVPYRVKL